MGLDRNDYIVFGYKIPYDREINYFDDEKFSKHINGDSIYTLIIDQMLGSYIVFGVLITQDNDGWDFVDLEDTDMFSEDWKFNRRMYLKHNAKELFNITENPKMFIFSHIS